MEELYDDGELDELDHAECLMNQAMHFMNKVFQSLKMRGAAGHLEKEGKKHEESTCDRGESSLPETAVGTAKSVGRVIAM